MRAGTLDRRIVVQSRAVAEDAFGGESETWSTYLTLSASYAPGKGTERQIAAQNHAELPAVFMIRDSAASRTIAPKTHRLSFDSAFWDIESVAEIGRGRARSIIARRAA